MTTTYKLLLLLLMAVSSGFFSIELYADQTDKLPATDARASEDSGHIHRLHRECPLPQTPQDVVECAMKEHPDVQRASLAEAHSSTLDAVARQIPNPDLDLESAIGGDGGEQRKELSIGLLQPIEWGGKWKARVAQAQAQKTVAGADLRDMRADAAIKTVLRLHRLRQLAAEKVIVNEVLQTLGKLIAQQRSRPVLSPEQQVTLSVYRMAQLETQIRQNELFEEERAIEHYFHIATGHSLEELAKALPKSPENWPEVDGHPKAKSVSPTLLQAQAHKQVAMAELKSARAAAWPDLRLGPKVEFERDGPYSSEVYGIRLMMGLPVLNTNRAGRAHAAQGVERSERLIELVRTEESHERAEQLRIYQNALAALKRIPTLPEMEREHRKNQSLARDGLISGPLLIESHRQWADLIRGRHGRELKAIEALWTIYKLDGRIFEVKL